MKYMDEMTQEEIQDAEKRIIYPLVTAKSPKSLDLKKCNFYNKIKSTKEKINMKKPLGKTSKLLAKILFSSLVLISAPFIFEGAKSLVNYHSNLKPIKEIVRGCNTLNNEWHSDYAIDKTEPKEAWDKARKLIYCLEDEKGNISKTFYGYQQFQPNPLTNTPTK